MRDGAQASPVVEGLHGIALLNAARGGVLRVDPEALGIQALQLGIVVMGAVAAALRVPADQLQRITPAQRILRALGRSHIPGNRRKRRAEAPGRNGR